MSAYQRVLIAIDFSPTCKQVLGRGIEVAKQNQSEVFLVHVVEYLPPIDFGYEPIIVPDWYSNEEEIVKQAEKSLKQLANEHSINEQNSIVLTGTPKNEISQFAGDKQVDLIVIGSHGRHGIQRLLGSTANPVLHSAQCDVLAVRIQD
jgi:universal stress protein A